MAYTQGVDVGVVLAYKRRIFPRDAPIKSLADLHGHFNCVDLSARHVSVEDCRIIRNVLANNNTIVEMKLRKCGISSLGAVLLAHGLKLNSTLLSLDLSGNSIEDEGACFLAFAVKNNDSLISVDLTENRNGSKKWSQYISRAVFSNISSRIVVEGCIFNKINLCILGPQQSGKTSLISHFLGMKGIMDFESYVNPRDPGIHFRTGEETDGRIQSWNIEVVKDSQFWVDTRDYELLSLVSNKGEFISKVSTSRKRNFTSSDESVQELAVFPYRIVERLKPKRRKRKSTKSSAANRLSIQRSDRKISAASGRRVRNQSQNPPDDGKNRLSIERRHAVSFSRGPIQYHVHSDTNAQNRRSVSRRSVRRRRKDSITVRGRLLSSLDRSVDEIAGERSFNLCLSGDEEAVPRAGTLSRLEVGNAEDEDEFGIDFDGTETDEGSIGSISMISAPECPIDCEKDVEWSRKQIVGPEFFEPKGKKKVDSKARYSVNRQRISTDRRHLSAPGKNISKMKSKRLHQLSGTILTFPGERLNVTLTEVSCFKSLPQIVSETVAPKSGLFLYVFNVTDKLSTFTDIKARLMPILKRGKQSRIILVATYVDLLDEKNYLKEKRLLLIDTAIRKLFKKHLKMFVPDRDPNTGSERFFFQVSNVCSTEESGSENLRRVVEFQLKQRIRNMQPIPMNWVKAFLSLQYRQMCKKRLPYVDFPRLERLLAKFGIKDKDELQRMLAYFDTAGYIKVENDAPFVVLNMQFVLNLLTKLLVPRRKMQLQSEDYLLMKKLKKVRMVREMNRFKNYGIISSDLMYYLYEDDGSPDFVLYFIKFIEKHLLIHRWNWRRLLVPVSTTSDAEDIIDTLNGFTEKEVFFVPGYSDKCTTPLSFLDGLCAQDKMKEGDGYYECEFEFGHTLLSPLVFHSVVSALICTTKSVPAGEEFFRMKRHASSAVEAPRERSSSKERINRLKHTRFSQRRDQRERKSMAEVIDYVNRLSFNSQRETSKTQGKKQGISKKGGSKSPIFRVRKSSDGSSGSSDGIAGRMPRFLQSIMQRKKRNRKQMSPSDKDLDYSLFEETALGTVNEKHVSFSDREKSTELLALEAERSSREGSKPTVRTASASGTVFQYGVKPRRLNNFGDSLSTRKTSKTSKERKGSKMLNDFSMFYELDQLNMKVYRNVAHLWQGSKNEIVLACVKDGMRETLKVFVKDKHLARDYLEIIRNSLQYLSATMEKDLQIPGLTWKVFLQVAPCELNTFLHPSDPSILDPKFHSHGRFLSYDKAKQWYQTLCKKTSAQERQKFVKDFSFICKTRSQARSALSGSDDSDVQSKFSRDDVFTHIERLEPWMPKEENISQLKRALDGFMMF